MEELPVILVAILSFLDLLARLGAGILLLCQALARRERFGLRLAACVAALFAAYYLTWAVVGGFALSAAGIDGGLPQMNSALGGYYAAQLVVFSALLVYCVVIVHALWEASWWTALFCCSAGYAVQNLASGVAELAWILAFGTGRAAGTEPRSSLPYFAVTWIATIAVYLAFWLLVTRHANRRGLERVSDRSMLGMMVIVILMIIGLDLVIKALCDAGLPLPYAVALRLAHGCVCIFTVWMEYELLINRRLDEERHVAQRLAAERTQQYEQDRQSMAAINARVHDIRHQVLRTLEASGAQVDRTTVAQIAREVDVYDAALRTGNEALDAALTQRSLVCRQRGVTFSCVADGHALDTLAPADAYELVGGALDEALAATITLEDVAARSISLNVGTRLGTAFVHVEATCGAAAGSPQRLHELRGIVDAYGGTLATSETGGVYHLNVLFPEGK